MLQRGHSGDGCGLASNLCKYDLRKGHLFVLSWARVRRVRRGSLSSELLMCGGGVRSILLLPLVARCLETIDGECECFIMQMLYVCVLCASCGSSQCCILHDLQFVNASRGCNMRPYRRGIFQSRSHNCFIGSHECLLLFIPSCYSKCFYDL